MQWKKKVLKTYAFFLNLFPQQEMKNLIFDKPIEYLSILIQDFPVKRIKIYRLYKSLL